MPTPQDLCLIQLCKLDVFQLINYIRQVSLKIRVFSLNKETAHCNISQRG
ncbi:hypothetical protein GXM_05967 [Nostoc sphaeroides CCNUC1]|uniref:Uncharacterized protein n=1 Tax=Nostoc sphaeroides CCNUC1 TaxID=2653204 RepID=A0A5P8W6S2_9NOSO|nr:hypothetical protein GXM_05967 [Nostoc sphaeroides CCNUC1]